MTPSHDTLTLHPAVEPATAYPTRDEAPGRRPTLPVVTGGALSASALAGCALLWPLLAPIFEHGGGGASFGCMAVVPPVFMSEEEAVEIVRQELEDAGYDGVETGDACTTFPIDKLHRRDFCGDIRDWEVLAGMAVTERFDLCDREAGFSLEIVTLPDHDKIVEEALFTSCSVWSLSLRDLADHVALQAVGGARSRYVALFYDPVGHETPEWWDTGEDTGPSAEEYAAEELRAQVRDFVAWLRDQGAEP